MDRFIKNSLLILWILLFGTEFFASAYDYCYHLDEVPYRNFGTITNYQTVYEKQPHTKISIANCEPAIIYMVIRHGSRYPDENLIKAMKDLLPRLKTHILQIDNSTFCEDDLERLKEWGMQMSEENSLSLAAEGRAEMKELAKRFKRNYPGLLNVPYNATEFQFLHTDTARTRDSARAFSKQLFGTEDGIDIQAIKVEEDWLMNYYKNCKKYKQVVSNLDELDNFNNGDEMKGILMSLKTKLKLDSLTMDDLSTLWHTCSYEYIIYGESPWCMIFTKEDLKVIEYQKDLSAYWAYGYGHEINYEQTCSLLRDIMMHLEMKNVNEKPSSFNVLTRFVHNGAIDTMFARMGLYRDSYNLTASGYLSSKQRKWRMSTTTPQAANIVFVKYSCTDDEEDKVALIVNEEPVTLPDIEGCSNGLCSLAKLKEAWSPYTDYCNLIEICGVEEDTSSANLISLSTLIYATLIMVLFIV